MFYWLCDCSAMHEILEYDGPIRQIRRWAQELLGYHFMIFHRPAYMMQDIDGLNHRFDDLLIEPYLAISQKLRDADQRSRPVAYTASAFVTSNPLKYCADDNVVAVPTQPPILLSSFTSFINLPIRLTPPSPTVNAPLPVTTYNSSHDLLQSRCLGWMSVTTFFGSVPAALSCHNPSSQVYPLICQPSATVSQPICRAILPHGTFVDHTLATVILAPYNYNASTRPVHNHTPTDAFLHCFSRFSGLNCTCPSRHELTQIHWLDRWLPSWIF